MSCYVGSRLSFANMAIERHLNSLAARPVLHMLVRHLRSPDVEVGEPSAGRGAGVVVVALVVGAHPQVDPRQDVGSDVEVHEVVGRGRRPVAILQELPVLGEATELINNRIGPLTLTSPSCYHW